MASQTYTARDLLRMRNMPVQRELCDRLQNKLRRDMDLTEVVRVSSGRSLPLIEEETTESLQDAADYRLPQPLLSRQLDGTDSEWRYRGRTDSEHDEVQPISAPSTLSAQKDEGFQRFYKAVVSPTHVRVTAGGRIVPNTRGSSSPTSKWAKEKATGNALNTSSTREPPAYSAFPIPQSPFGAYPPMFPGFFPAPPHSHHSYPLMPWPMGFTIGGAFGMPLPGSIQASPSGSTVRNSAEPTKDSNSVNCEPPETTKAVPLSSPERFDPSRPFLYNGQWMMHPGSQLYPYGTPPLHGIQATHGLHCPPIAPQGSPGNSTAPVDLPNDQHSTSMQSQHGQPASATTAANLPPAYKPPISSIRPSEITRKQIEVLRGSLKYLEDQLQYNKHQIDEKGMESQAQIVRQQVQQFEKNLESQLDFEKVHYPNKVEVTSSDFSHESGQSKSSTISEAKHDVPTSRTSCTSPEEGLASRTSKARATKEKLPSRFSAGINSTKSVCAFPPARISAEGAEYGEPTKRTTGLPVTAALAPPFQPNMKDSHMEAVERDSCNGHFSSHSLLKNTNENGPSDRLVSPETAFPGHSGSYYVGSRQSAPYLIGQIPTDVASGFTRNIDYVYNRELTEDELRARHMYWGMAPAHLQKGLPKFDGKDFYPPSPTKEASPVPSSHKLSIEDVRRSHETPSLRSEIESQWFRPIPRSKRQDTGNATQSESLPQCGPRISSGIQRPDSCVAPTSRKYDLSRKAVPSSARGSTSTDSKGPCSSDDRDDDKTLLFKGRKSMGRTGTKTHNEIWQSVLKKGKTSANATPGTVSSMTAQGVLPNYTGHATASLTPTIANTSTRLSKNKAVELIHEERTNGTLEKRGENLPPNDHNPRQSFRRDSRPGSSRKGMTSH